MGLKHRNVSLTEVNKLIELTETALETAKELFERCRSTEYIITNRFETAYAMASGLSRMFSVIGAQDRAARLRNQLPAKGPFVEVDGSADGKSADKKRGDDKPKAGAKKSSGTRKAAR